MRTEPRLRPQVGLSRECGRQSPLPGAAPAASAGHMQVQGRAVTPPPRAQSGGTPPPAGAGTPPSVGAAASPPAASPATAGASPAGVAVSHQKRLAYLATECAGAIDALAELGVQAQARAAALAGAAADLQRASGALGGAGEELGDLEDAHAVRARGGRGWGAMGRGARPRAFSACRKRARAPPCFALSPPPTPAAARHGRQALRDIDAALCTLGALQLEDALARPAARTARALRALQGQLARQPPPQSLTSGTCFKVAIEAQQAWRAAAAAAREAGAAAGGVSAALGAALDKLGAASRELAAAAQPGERAALAAAVQQGATFTAACLDALRLQAAAEAAHVAAADGVSQRLQRLQAGMAGKVDADALREAGAARRASRSGAGGAAGSPLQPGSPAAARGAALGKAPSSRGRGASAPGAPAAAAEAAAAAQAAHLGGASASPLRFLSDAGCLAPTPGDAAAAAGAAGGKRAPPAQLEARSEATSAAPELTLEALAQEDPELASLLATAAPSSAALAALAAPPAAGDDGDSGGGGGGGGVAPRDLLGDFQGSGDDVAAGAARAGRRGAVRLAAGVHALRQPARGRPLWRGGGRGGSQRRGRPGRA